MRTEKNWFAIRYLFPFPFSCPVSSGALTDLSGNYKLPESMNTHTQTHTHTHTHDQERERERERGWLIVEEKEIMGSGGQRGATSLRNIPSLCFEPHSLHPLQRIRIPFFHQTLVTFPNGCIYNMPGFIFFLLSAFIYVLYQIGVGLMCQG